MTRLTIRPLIPALWPALEDLFGPNGANSGCWCMWWRIGSGQIRVANSEQNRAAFQRVVREGPPPGLLAFDGDLAVGWCQITPRESLPRLDRSGVLARVDDLPVWSVSCFYIRRGYRRHGVMTALIGAAVKHAKANGAPALEAYPWDGRGKPGSRGTYTGIRSAFANVGFNEVARRRPDRPIMRHDLRRVRVGALA
ncbi:MAG TPA: GNAT family N-acetyltransferase [Rhizomicrobium sp.]|jgi:GNAT superfamily N-acetyltransferase